MPRRSTRAPRSPYSLEQARISLRFKRAPAIPSFSSTTYVVRTEPGRQPQYVYFLLQYYMAERYVKSRCRLADLIMFDHAVVLVTGSGKSRL